MVEDQKTKSTDAAEVIELLQAQVALYEKLKELAERQRLLISHGQSEALLEILAERQRLVDGLSEINRTMSSVRKDWESIKSRMTQQQRTEAETLVQQVGESLQEIMASDEADSRALNSRRDQVGQSLATLRTKEMAASAYGHANDGNRYLDQDG